MAYQYRPKNHLGLSLRLTFIVLALTTGLTASQTQTPPSSREIVAEDFTKNRPKGSSQSKGGRTKKIYRLASGTTGARSKGTASSLQQLGITLWRLRPGNPGETGARMAVIEEGKPSEWIPERIEADATINFGDRVRITFESPRAGFLYIVDRDVFADGTLGDAVLIFPTLGTRGGDNQVRPGKLIDIPAADDSQGYFIAKPIRNDQVGELLSIIVTSAPLSLPIPAQPLKLASSEILGWETAWGAPAERFEMVGGAGQVWTENERLASARSGTRQLTQEGPAPQTIYRFSPKRSDGVLVSLRLNYRPAHSAN